METRLSLTENTWDYPLGGILALNTRVSALDMLLSLKVLQKTSLLFTQTPNIVYIPRDNCHSHNSL